MKTEVYKILDLGEIELIDTLGTDLTVVNSARVSFGNRKQQLDNKDIVLMQYLADNKHFSPFRHIQLQFRVKFPEFVARQWYKHVVGAETTSSYPTKDHAWNEISGRYKPVEDFHFPSEWRAQSNDNKQASNGLVEDQESANILFNETMVTIMYAYEKLLQLGVAKEQARILLPLNQYTEVYWTASFQAVGNFMELRDHEHAQFEIREYAKVIHLIMLETYPEATKAWLTRRF